MRRILDLVLVALVAVFFVLNLVVTSVYAQFVGAFERERTEGWARTAEQVSGLVPDALALSNPEVIARVREQYRPVAVITIASPGGASTRAVMRPAQGDLTSIALGRPQDVITVHFEGTSAQALRRASTLARGTAIGGIIAGGLLLFVNLLSMAEGAKTLSSDPGMRQADPGEEGLMRTMSAAIADIKGEENRLRVLNLETHRRSEELMRLTGALTHNINSGFLSFDRADQLFDLNDAAREILGVGAAAPGGTLREFVGESPFSTRLDELVRTRTAVQRLELTHAAGGTTRIIGLTTVPLFERGGAYLGCIALFTDLSPIRRLEERVRQTEVLADVGEIAAGVAHEVRNSLSTILGYLTLARRSADASLETKLTAAEREAADLLKAVEGLLQFSRPVQLELQEIDAAAVLEDIARRLVSSEHSIELRVDLRPVQIEADPPLLARAFENLVRNAIDAVRSRGNGAVIALHNDAANGRTLLISDNGGGIAAEDRERVFLPFSTTKANGVGMGLPITKKVLLLHGARIALSGGDGGGTTVRVEFADPPDAG